jgi:hypothetical protein
VTMAIFPWSKTADGKDEKQAGAPPSPQADATGEGYTSEEGAIDVADDDLHRGMRPRQLSGLTAKMRRSVHVHTANSSKT